MARIGIDARLLHYRTGGISTYIRQLVGALGQATKYDFDFTIYHHRKDGQTLDGKLGRGRLWTPAHHRLERLTLSVELLSQRLDIWHSPDFIPPYRGGRRHVITVHDLTFWHYPQYLTEASRRYYNAQIEQACHHADVILAVSDATKRDLIDILGIDAGKIRVQPHGVDASYRPMAEAEVRPVLDGLGLRGAYFVHVGTLEPRKNIVGLLEGYRAVLDAVPDAPSMVLVGRRGWLFEASEARIEALQLGDKLIRLEQVNDEQLPAIYNGAMALITPSFYEGFGMPALEAMACGTVPIVSDVSSLPEVVGDVGLLVKPDDTQSIAEALLRVLQDDAWREKTCERALERAKRFTWEHSAQIALDAYKSVL